MKQINRRCINIWVSARASFVCHFHSELNTFLRSLLKRIKWASVAVYTNEIVSIGCLWMDYSGLRNHSSHQLKCLDSNWLLSQLTTWSWNLYIPSNNVKCIQMPIDVMLLCEPLAYQNYACSNCSGEIERKNTNCIRACL